MGYVLLRGENSMNSDSDSVKDENRRIRLFRISSDLLIQLIMTRPMSIAEAEGMIDGLRILARQLFPGKDHVFDLIYMPRFRRALREAGLYHGNPDLRLVDAGCSGGEAT
jgi:hypothetical protein